MDATKRGEVPKDHAILRQISALALMLPAIEGDAFTTEFLREYNDTLLVTTLASMTKGANQLSDVVDKFNTAHEKRRRGFWG